MSNFHPLEVVGRGSETQLQVGEKWCCVILITSFSTNIGLASYVCWVGRQIGLILAVSANTRRCANAGLMLDQRRRRWANIKPALAQSLVSTGISCIVQVLNYIKDLCQCQENKDRESPSFQILWKQHFSFSTEKNNNYTVMRAHGVVWLITGIYCGFRSGQMLSQFSANLSFHVLPYTK